MSWYIVIYFSSLQMISEKNILIRFLCTMTQQVPFDLSTLLDGPHPNIQANISCFRDSECT